MKKLIFFCLVALSISSNAQTLQYGDWYFRGRVGVNKPTNNLHPNAVFEVGDSASGTLLRVYKDGTAQSFKLKNNAAGDSLLTLDQYGKFKMVLKAGPLAWDSITGKPSLLISGNNLADVSNVATARDNLSVYSKSVVDDSLLNHYTKGQADGRFKGIGWLPGISDVTGLPDSLTAVQGRIQTKQQLLGFTAVPDTRTVNGHALSADVTVTKSDVGLSNVPNTDATNAANISSGTLPDARLSGNVTTQGNSFNSANQLVKLDVSGKLPTSTIPSLALVETFVVSSQSAMLALSAQMGDVAVRTDNNKSYILQSEPASTLANWIELLVPSSEADPVYTASSWFSTTNNSGNWNTAYSWGNHASAGYLLSSTAAATYYPLTNPSGYITGNQTITLSGDVSGSGATAITTTIGALKVTNSMLAGSIDYAKMNAATVPTWNQNTTGNAATATNSTQWNGNSYLGVDIVPTSGYVMTYSTSDNFWHPVSLSNMQTWFGLGSYAYRSSGLAELTGATFTGAVNGTSLSMSGLGEYGGTIRATGATGGLATGSGVEIRNNSGIGELFTYNRATAAYLPTKIDGSTLGLNTLTGGAITLGGSLSGTTASFSGNGTFGGAVVAKASSNDSWIFQGLKSGSSTTIAGFYQNASGNGLMALYDASATNTAFFNGVANTLSGTLTVSSSVTASSFIGAGSALTSLPSNTALYPTLNQNTTGTAANSTLWNGASYTNTGSGTVSYFMTNSGSTWNYSTVGQVQTALGLQSAAYEDQSYFVNVTTSQAEINGNKTFTGAVEVNTLKTNLVDGAAGVIKIGAKTNDTVFTGGSQYSLPINIDGVTYYIRLWATVN